MIYYFSATGNSQHVATRIAEALGTQAQSIEAASTEIRLADGECVMKYSGEQVKMGKGDCVIIVANHLVTELHPTDDFHAKIIFIEPGFMDVCTPHTSYGIVGGMTMFINPVMHLDERAVALLQAAGYSVQ